MRLAVIDPEKCKPQKCNKECQHFCPRVRSGDETVTFGEDLKAIISEELCVGCGICVKKCPMDAIMIVNLPEALTQPMHRYGKNAFALFNLPVPQFGSVVGIVGPNGVGKTTAVRILAGELKPNMGVFESEKSWKEIAGEFGGQELQNYFEKLDSGLKAVYKPQYVDQIPKVVKGTVHNLLKKADERKILKKIVADFGLEACLDRKVSQISGGELQRVACAVCIMKKADLYMFDEPSSYLDVRERLKLAKVIRDLAAEGKAVLVVEHDLVVLDYLADYVHVLYGKPRAYGVVSKVYSSRNGINIYLNGYLPEENVKFRSEPLTFSGHEAAKVVDRVPLIKFEDITKKFKDFTLEVEGGEIDTEEVVGILGPNATGKTTYMKILAGELKPDGGELKEKVKISYKPQYLEPNKKLVMEVLRGSKYSKWKNLFKSFALEELMDRQLDTLSGGELQRVAITECLCKDADVYLLDEPSAHMDVEQRVSASKIIRDMMIKNERTAIVVDHDVLFIDYLSDRLMVFLGDPGKKGIASAPEAMRHGMNRFLKQLEITVRRDPDTGRPRVNKLDSVKDREQKKKGEYYYT